MSRKKRKPISTGSDWTFELIEAYDREIGRVAREFGLDTYPNQIEIITSEQMMDAYSSVGMPLNYNHWSFGKQFVETEQNYTRGRMGLAYEIVINSNPCIAYLMEENTITMQALVIAHACYGHNSFFKGNYLFRTWTDASAIIDYLLFAKNYIRRCEEKHGVEEVEQLLDSCHALMNYGVNRYKRPRPLTAAEERERQQAREEYIQRHLNELWNTTVPRKADSDDRKHPRFPADPEENILYFIEKNAPLLESWQREIVRIVRKVAQYFYPQSGMEAMIIDERYNGGGFVGDMIIDRLERGLWAMTIPREGKTGRNPERVFHGPLAVLINEDTGSNGEFFAHAIKVKGLAHVIGMRTWGGSIGIEPHQDLVDGGVTTPPQFGIFGIDRGDWIIEGWGVEPHQQVQNMPADVVAGRDAQLEAAVAHLLGELRAHGDRWRIPATPAYPDKSRPRMSGVNR